MGSSHWEACVRWNSMGAGSEELRRKSPSDRPPMGYLLARAKGGQSPGLDWIFDPYGNLQSPWRNASL